MKRLLTLFAALLLSLPALAQDNEPQFNADIKTIMLRYKQGAEFEKIAAMPAEQRAKLMAYYQKGKAAGVKDRLLATGMGSIVRGYEDIEGMRTWVAEYEATNRVPKKTGLPLPYLNFTNAAEKFPEAQVMFASELEATKKMEAQIEVILEAISADADKRSADAGKRSADADKRSADADKRSADADKRSAELRKRIEFLDTLLKGMDASK